MARRQVLTVRPRPELKRNRLYRARVQKTDINRKAATLDVTVEHIEKEQAGRLHNLRFDLPLYPESPVSRFLVACGLAVSQVGDEVCVDDAVGAIVAMTIPVRDSDETAATFEAVLHTGHDSHRDGGGQSTASKGQLDDTISREDLP
jgi:hypothetical protein